MKLLFYQSNWTETNIELIVTIMTKGLLASLQISYIDKWNCVEFIRTNKPYWQCKLNKLFFESTVKFEQNENKYHVPQSLLNSSFYVCFQIFLDNNQEAINFPAPKPSAYLSLMNGEVYRHLKLIRIIVTTNKTLLSTKIY